MFAINCIECAFLKLRWSPRKIKKSLFKHKSLKYFPGAICYPTNLPNASNDTAVISSISKSPQFHRKCRYALTLLWYIDNIVNIYSHSIAFLHGVWTPNEAFFHWNPELLGLDRQIGKINFGAFGVFSAKLSAPILVQWVPCPCSPIINHYFYK